MADPADNENVATPPRSVVFTRAAARGLRRISKVDEDLIRQKLRQLAADPASLANNIKALRGGENRYRLRVGDFRAIFTIEQDRIVVHDAGPRSSIYR